MFLTIGGLKRLSQYMGGQLKAAVAITGGTINGATVGATSATTGKFTTLESTGTLKCGTNMIRSVAATVSAAGTSQATATALTADINNVTTVGSGTGVILPVPVAGTKITVFSNGANNLLVYPNSGATIDANSANTAVTLTFTKRCDYIATSATAWLSAQLGATSA